MWPSVVIKRITHRISREFLGNIHVRDLRQRMHTGIRTSRSLHQAFLTRKAENSAFQNFLHRQAVVLALPAMKGPAIVFDSQLVTGHVRHSLAVHLWIVRGDNVDSIFL